MVTSAPQNKAPRTFAAFPQIFSIYILYYGLLYYSGIMFRVIAFDHLNRERSFSYFEKTFKVVHKYKRFNVEDL